MLVEATNSGNASAILFTHLVLARHRMEVGDYPRADKSLDDIQRALTDYSTEKIQEAKNLFYTKLACKYYHLSGKNKTRAYYYERAKEVFEDGIEIVNGIQGQDTLRDKYLCKLYEGLGHLMCEPLYFEKCEEYLNKAEAIY